MDQFGSVVLLLRQTRSEDGGDLRSSNSPLSALTLHLMTSGNVQLAANDLYPVISRGNRCSLFFWEGGLGGEWGGLDVTNAECAAVKRINSTPPPLSSTLFSQAVQRSGLVQREMPMMIVGGFLSAGLGENSGKTLVKCNCSSKHSAHYLIIRAA